MNYTIDTTAAVIAVERDGDVEEVSLYSTEGFELLSDLWLKVGWNQKHSYTFTWMGIPVIQQPEDLVRMQEVIYTLQPDVIVETGVAHGGSLIFYASLLQDARQGPRRRRRHRDPPAQPRRDRSPPAVRPDHALRGQLRPMRRSSARCATRSPPPRPCW